MPFNLFEGLGVVSRIRGIRDASVYLCVFPVVLGWSLVMGVVGIVDWVRRLWNVLERKIMDEYDDEMEQIVSDEETEGLLSPVDPRSRLVRSMEVVEDDSGQEPEGS